jgi:hypothetical protein
MLNPRKYLGFRNILLSYIVYILIDNSVFEFK